MYFPEAQAVRVQTPQVKFDWVSFAGQDLKVVQVEALSLNVVLQLLFFPDQFLSLIVTLVVVQQIGSILLKPKIVPLSRPVANLHQELATECDIGLLLQLNEQILIFANHFGLSLELSNAYLVQILFSFHPFGWHVLKLVPGSLVRLHAVSARVFALAQAT